MDVPYKLEDIYGTVKRFHNQGLDMSETIEAISMKENHMVKIFCMGNVSMKNMIRSAYASLKSHMTQPSGQTG